MHPPACSLETRQTHTERLESTLLDVLIIGGGINGAGIARDLALRAHQAGTTLRVGLVEARHFASGTSGKNSQLIHGGLRYLKNLQFGLVREALRERAILLAIAPHLVQPLEFVIPNYDRTSRWFYGAGLVLYDALAGAAKIGRHRAVSRTALLRMEPALEAADLRSALVYNDCRVNSARLVLENVWDAMRHGAIAANYLRVESCERADNWSVTLLDTISGARTKAQARQLINATGPWSSEGPPRLVRGSHIIVPRLASGERAIAYFEPGGRVIFFIPWGSRLELTLVGTTDVDHSSGPDQVHITAEEVRYLRAMIARVFPKQMAAEPIAAYSSLRPLIHDESKSATRASREHKIWRAAGGKIHVTGGKYTTYRAMSEECCDLALADIAPELARLHVTRDAPLARCGPESAGIEERISYAVQHEMAQTLADVLFVSTYWGYEQRLNRDVLRPIALAMGGILGWDAERVDREIEHVQSVTSVPD